MAETPFTIGADARCTDGVCGKVTRVVVDPVARTVTQLVVQPGNWPEDTDFAPSAGSDQYPGYSSEQMLMLPYYGRIAGADTSPAGDDQPAGAYGALPPGEVGVRRDKRVLATDGEVGRVEGLVVDPGNHHVSHVLLQQGHVFGRRQVAIPIDAVTGVVDSVQLDLTKQQVENLPPVKTDHPNG